MHKPAGLTPAGIVDMNTDIFVSQCTTRNTNNLMHTQAGSCTNVKQTYEDGDIGLMLRFSMLVFFHLLPFLLRMMHTHSLSRPAGQHNHGRAHRRRMECKGGWRRTCFRDTVRCGHGRLCPGSKGLSSVPTMLTGPGNGHCDPGDATHCNARQQSTYVEQRLETFSTWSA